MLTEICLVSLVDINASHLARVFYRTGSSRPEELEVFEVQKQAFLDLLLPTNRMGFALDTSGLNQSEVNQYVM